MIFVAVALVVCLFRNSHSRVSLEHEQICDYHFKQIAVAIQAYHAMYGVYPPSHLLDNNGNRTHSWRALILPFTDHDQAFRAYDFTVPWNHPKNRRITEDKGFFRSSRLFACPNATLGSRQPFDPEHDFGLNLETNYVMVEYDGHGFFDKPHSTSPLLEDGVVIVELADSKIFWAEPRDVDSLSLVRKRTSGRQLLVSSNDPHGAIVLYSDGRTKRIKAN